MGKRGIWKWVALVVIGGNAAWGQSTPPPQDPATQEVRRSIETAQKEITAFRDGGGKNDDPAHPAVKWLGLLWEYRQKYPGTPAAGLATAEALHLLYHSDRVDDVLSRADALAADDPAWERLPSVLNEAATARKDPSLLTTRLERIAAQTGNARIRASALVALGRAYRSTDPARARTLLERALKEAPDSPAAREADTLLYEIANLSVGRPAPAFSATAWKGKPLALAGYKNQALVLVFWAST